MATTTMPLRVERLTRAYWRATIDNPPINLFDPDLLAGFRELIEELESDDEVKVIVLDSADPDYFISHLDLNRAGEGDRSPGPTGMSPWPDFALRLAAVPVISVASVRGRARGVGNEVALAADVRFASREKAIFGQFEIGSAAMPGGGGLERLSLLLGRARAIEAVVGGEDFDAETAERYGWINRAVPDDELDALVDRFARRVASFDGEALKTAKAHINRMGGVPTVEQLSETEKAFFALLQRPEAKERIGFFFAQGLQERGDFELNLGERIGPPEAQRTGA